MGVNFVLRGAEELEASDGTAKLFVTACVFLIIAVGGVVFLVLNTWCKPRSVAGAPRIKAGGYEKLDANGGIGLQATSPFGDYSDRIVEDEDDEEDEEDDIVYMAQDGTVYRKFKYGLLDEDEIELEYDDESYSYRWKQCAANLAGPKRLFVEYRGDIILWNLFLVFIPDDQIELKNKVSAVIEFLCKPAFTTEMNAPQWLLHSSWLQLKTLEMY